MTRRNIVLMLLFVAFIGSIVVGASAKGCSNLFRRDEKDAGASGVIPIAPSGLTATAISSTQINLSWTDNDAYEQGVKIERKTGISGTYSQIATVGRNISLYSDITGLSPATLYYYRARAYYVASNSDYSNEVNVTTPDTGWDMPFTLTLNVVSPTQIGLTWSDNFSAESGFGIERKTGSSGTYAQIGTVGVNITTTNDSTVTQNTTYYYRVKVNYASATGIYSQEAWARTSGITSNFWADITATLSARTGQTAIWADGVGMLVYGGDGYITNGSIYSPTVNAWNAISAGGPSARVGHSAVWTGTEMLIWGGELQTALFMGYDNPTSPTYEIWQGSAYNGSRYTPDVGWAAIAATNVADRTKHSAVWTGNRMIIWGGEQVRINISIATSATTVSRTRLNTGGVYNPATNSWDTIDHLNSGFDAPTARTGHTAIWDSGAVWPGGAMLIWGGDTGSPSNTGGIYEPVTDAWIPDMSGSGAPTARIQHTAVWTGGSGSNSWDNKLIIWGGTNGTSAYYNTGAIFDPVANTWSTITTTDAPAARTLHSAVWTGSKMIIWGGGAGVLEGAFNNGGVYDPATGTWAPTSTGGAPGARTKHTAVWDPVGKKMLIWGGWDALTTFNNGGAYTSD